MVLIFSCAKLIQYAFQSDDLANADKKTLIIHKEPGKSTIHFIINNRQKIDLTEQD